MTKGTITTTRSGKPRENPSPQAMARELESLKGEIGGLKRVLAPAFAPPMRSTMSRGPGEYRREPYVMQQASSNCDPWAGDYEHSPQFMAEAVRGGNIAELRQRSAQDAIMRAESEARRQVVTDEVRVFCGRNGCRPSTQCPNCAGRTRTVVYRSDTEAPVQSSVVFSPWGHDTPAMDQQAARDQTLNAIEYRHAAAVAAEADRQRQANAVALAEQSEAIRLRQHAERMQQRPPGEGGEVLKGC
jgi:hypothetical protein